MKVSMVGAVAFMRYMDKKEKGSWVFFEQYDPNIFLGNGLKPRLQVESKAEYERLCSIYGPKHTDRGLMFPGNDKPVWVSTCKMVSIHSDTETGLVEDIILLGGEFLLPTFKKDYPEDMKRKLR